MREILFRGKTKKGDWVEGFYVCNRYSIGFAKEPAICENHYIYTKRIDSEKWFKTVQVEVIPETVGQFAGLTDKNGKKIFEGDIVKLFFYDKEQDTNYELIGQVESVLFCGLITIYEEKVNALELFNKTISNKIEVIGNIHDNPELLGE